MITSITTIIMTMMMSASAAATITTMSIITIMTTMMTMMTSASAVATIMTMSIITMLTTMTATVVVTIMITIITIIHADEVFTSWGMENVAPCKKEELEAFLQDLSKGDVYGQVLRAKGMIPSETEGEWYYFDLVPEEYEIRKGQPDYTGKVCVIGAKLDEEALKKVFHK